MQVKSTNSYGIEKPTLVLDKSKAVRNIERMVDKAKRQGVRLRPHFKTHQSADVGDWFRQRGVEAITVSSVDMASYFADSGWQDITIAFPVNPLQIRRINQLAAQVSLGLLVESEEMVDFLDQHLENEASVWIKIDAGYHRTGLDWQALASIRQLARRLDGASRLRLRGLLTHSGHTYQQRTRDGVHAVYHAVLERLVKVQKELAADGLKVMISVGDTPGCSLVEELGPVDEIRPGNFVFYDLMQAQIGACTADDIAVAVACPIVAKHADRQQLILYGGAVHLSKESLRLENGQTLFGRIALPTESGWGPQAADAALISISQEHGVAQVSAALFDDLSLGDILMVLPVHSCLTANLYQQYLLPDGTVIPMPH